MHDIVKIQAALLKKRLPQAHFQSARQSMVHDLTHEAFANFNDNLEHLMGMTVSLFANRVAEKIIARSSLYPLPKKEKISSESTRPSIALTKPVIGHYTHSWFSENIAQMQEERRVRHSFVEKVQPRRLKEIAYMRPNAGHIGCSKKKEAYNPLKALLDIFLKGNGPSR